MRSITNEERDLIEIAKHAEDLKYYGKPKQRTNLTPKKKKRKK